MVETVGNKQMIIDFRIEQGEDACEEHGPTQVSPAELAPFVVKDVSDLIWVLDEEHNLTFSSAAVHSELGYSAEEVLGKNVSSFLSPGELPDLLEHLKQLMSRPGIYEEWKFHLAHANGSSRLFRGRVRAITVRGRPCFLLTCSSFEASQWLEEDLRRHKEWQKYVELASNDAIWDWDLARGRVTWNQGVYELFGYTPGEVDRSDPWWSERIHPADKARVVEGIHAVIDKGGEFWGDHYRFRRADNSYAHVVDRGFVIRDEEGRALRMIGTLADITDRHSLEEQLLQSQKMEAMGRLAGGVAHDFNNLLTAIIGYAQLNVMSLPVGDRARRDLQEIQKAAERAASLTRQLLAFSRRQVIEPRVVKLNDLIFEMDKMLRRLIGEDIELVTLPAPDLGHIRVDPGQIEQVIVNLAVNARDAMPEGGKLRVVTENSHVSLDDPRVLGGLSAGKYVTLEVKDTGMGMTEEVKARIFEPFFTTKEPGKGTGLGLATCYGIVKQSGGHIEVDSEPGKGAKFAIYFPRIEESAAALPKRDDLGFLPQGQETVLLVEDEPSVRGLALRILQELGYSVLVASNGDEALRVLKDNEGRKIDLLLSDVVMPQLGGRELAERFRLIHPEAKIILVSGYTDDALVRQSLPEQGIAFLQKPFTPASFARKVREVLDQRSLKEDARRTK
jgi:PAS domain S-box-containing protein